MLFFCCFSSISNEGIGSEYVITEAGWSNFREFEELNESYPTLNATYSDRPLYFYMKVEIDKYTFKRWFDKRAEYEIQIPIIVKLFRRIGFNVRRESTLPLNLYTGNDYPSSYLRELKLEVISKSYGEIIVYSEIPYTKPGRLIVALSDKYGNEVQCHSEKCNFEIEILR